MTSSWDCARAPDAGDSLRAVNHSIFHRVYGCTEEEILENVKKWRAIVKITVQIALEAINEHEAN